MNLDELTQRLHRIRDQNDWKQFHSPKNLAMAASVEMSELVEIFQWRSEEESWQVAQAPETAEHVRQELADVALYLVRLASVWAMSSSAATPATCASSMWKAMKPGALRQWRSGPIT